MSLVEVLNKHSGYIPLWRDGWEDWDWYYDDVVKNVFFYCYKRASYKDCLLYTSPSPRDRQKSRMPSSA